MPGGEYECNNPKIPGEDLYPLDLYPLDTECIPKESIQKKTNAVAQ